jgi:S-DNA-T family DNA segregation ATPase FtsK/SpoIIIE
VVLDETGAENLLGNGDMLYKIQGEPIKRALGCYISEDNINRILNKKLI